MESLSPQARAHLAAFRRDETPDRAVADRCLAALEQRLDDVAADEHHAHADRRRKLATRVFAGVALAAGVLLALTWAVMRPDRPPAGNVAAPYQLHTGDPPQRPTERPKPPPEPDLALEPAPPELAPEALPAPKPAPSDSSRSGKRPPRADDAVAAEVDLLRRAKLADPSARLDLLGEHARRFPTGILAAERGLLEIEARCALGQVDTARDLAQRFAARFPGSPLVDRAVTLCSSSAAQP